MTMKASLPRRELCVFDCEGHTEIIEGLKILRKKQIIKINKTFALRMLERAE